MAPTDLQLEELARAVGDSLLAKGWRVSTAESCTGGWIAKVFTDVAGSSAWFGWGFVSYANAAKTSMLGVEQETLARHGAVSEPVTRAMAEGARRASGAQVTVAVSGIAGPEGGTDEKPVGTVWFAWATAGGCRSECAHFGGDREAVRRHAVGRALVGLKRLLAADA